MAHVAPTFAGAAIFGDQFSFSAQPIGTSPAAVDAWLGLTPGTTQYGAPPGGQLWGATGTLIGPSSGAVTALQAALAASSGMPSVFLWPTNDVSNPLVAQQNCYFVASEIVYSGGGIINIGGTYTVHDDGATDAVGGQYQVAYTMVLRQLSQS